MSHKTKKKKLAIVSLTSCEGCQSTIIDLGRRFVDLLKRFELAEMPLLEDKPDAPRYDIAVVTGSPLSQKEEEKLRKIRKKARLLVALGTCACLGGIPERGNPKIKPLSRAVKVDLEILGCPPTNSEVLEMLYQLNLGRIPRIPRRPVCFECPLFAENCFLHQNKLCLGPITLAGCGAICPKNNYRCEGCRGPIKDEKKENIKNLTKLLKKIAQPREIKHLLQRFGLEDDLYR